MEFPLSNISAVSTAATMFAFLFLCYNIISKTANISYDHRRKTAPPAAAGAKPVIGHLHLLGGRELPHKTLGAMADKYGPIFMIKLGVRRVVVVSDSEMAKHCFTTNDKALADRPKSLATEVMGYDYAMFGLGPYGPYWRQLRRILTTHLLSNSHLESLKHVWISEVKASIKELYEVWTNKRRDNSNGTVLVEMKDWFGDTSVNMVVRILTGERDSSSKEEKIRCREVLKDFFRLLGTFTVSDALPFLRYLDLGGHEKAMKKTAKDIDCLLEGWLQQHKSKRSSMTVQSADGNRDFMDVMMSIFNDTDVADDDDLKGFNADTIIKAMCLTVLTGSSETVTTSLIWALSLLLNNTQVLKKAQEELEMHIGRKRTIVEQDMKNLPYLNAIIKETLRMYPPGPLGSAHECREDCSVGGYHIPAGAQILTNVWKIHRDPKTWRDPEQFQPDRFLTATNDKGIDVTGGHFELIPFGAGRRICPGISLAMRFLHFTLASLIHGFDFVAMSNDHDQPIDMTESIEATNFKATPLQVLIAPRLPSHLYA